MKSKKILQKDFMLVVIGQIISLFGNAILRYALPVYLLNETHSASLFGIVSACAFIPMVILSPIGGIIADRVNKRNIMVTLDFFTAVLVLVFSCMRGRVNLVMLILVTLVLLYGVQGAYQPTVQASIPALVEQDNLMSANAIINLVSSGAGLVGPVIGGILFAVIGLTPILIISIVCFFASACMEIFICIPYVHRKSELRIMQIAVDDLKESYHFIKDKNPLLGQISLLIAIINFSFSALIIIGIPIIITQVLGFQEQTGNTLYGYAEGALAAGGLIGGILAGTVGKRLNIKKSYKIILLCSLTLLPMGVVLMVGMNKMAAYITIVISCFVMMMLSTVFSIQMMSFVQQVTPMKLIGKVMAFVMSIALCAQPIGQAMYGILFQMLKEQIYIIFYAATLICVIIGWLSKKSFSKIGA